jgi:hypothetical protein
MKLKEIREAYEELSGAASKLTRQLALAGIGMIWIFRVFTGEHTSIPDGLLWPSILLVSSLGIDLFQYLAQSITWYIYYFSQRKKNVKEDEYVNEPEYLNYPASVLFFAKIDVMIIAYATLFNYLRSLPFGSSGG